MINFILFSFGHIWLWNILFLYLSLQNSNSQRRGDIRFMFYNVENFFDIYDDSLTLDEEFTPEGAKRWNEFKYYKKCSNIYKVIAGVGEWELPELIGLVEIENRKVIDDLLKFTPLLKGNYRIVHKESPDKRGIDVAFLYRHDSFKPLTYKAIPVNYNPNFNSRTTRDILYIKGVVGKKDTLHIFINHWSSRWGGQINTEWKRVAAATILKDYITDNLTANDNIIIAGDFNDYPDNKSLAHTLNAKIIPQEIEKLKENDLYNLAYIKSLTIGSYKYKGEWGILDQIIVSGNLLVNNKGIHIKNTFQNIYQKDFIMEKDKSYSGFKPFRTYSGYRYLGGFSDHLPVFLDMYFK